MSNKNRIDANNEKIEELIELVKQKKAMIGGAQKPFNLVSYINGTLTEVDDVNGDIKSVGLYYSTSNYNPVFSFSFGGISFMKNTQLKYVNLQGCTDIYQRAFLDCSSLDTLSLPNCERIYSYAFSGCNSLSIVDLPKCNFIGDYAFRWLSHLTKLVLPECKFIGDYAFANCSSISQIEIDKCEYIASFAFSSCNALEYLDAPECSYVGISAFANCSNLSYINLPECLAIEKEAFNFCSSLASISLPKVKRLGLPTDVYPTVFAQCSSIQELDLPELEEFYAMLSSTNIHTLKMSKVRVIGKSAFQYASYTFSIYIYASSVPVLTGSAYDTFRNSPFNSGAGKIYVPSSLYDEYRIATNWAALPASAFVSF